jgi:hypothetical protein
MAGVFGLSDFRVEQLEGNVEESANYGYFGSGFTPPFTRIDVLERIDISNETVSLPGGGTSTRNKLGSFSSSEYGYFCGGSSTPTTEVNWVRRIDFSNEVPSSPFTLITSVSEVEGLSSPNYGYLGGGWTVVLTDTISRTDLTTETNSNPGLTLTQGRGIITTVSSSDHGYFCGGYSPSTSSIIDRIDLSSETVVGPPVHGATVQARKDCAGVFTSNYGYICGGPTDLPAILIDRLDFSSDTVSQPGVDLNQKRDTARGVNSLDYGYFGGGYGGGDRVNTIDRIDFSTETTSAATNNLSQAKNNLAAVSGGKRINAKGFKKYRTDISGKSISGKYAYYGGGYAISSPYQNIDRMEYATETMTTLPSDFELSQGRSELSAAGNSNYGYFIGGWSQPLASSKIDRMDFSNETLTDNLSLNPTAFGTSGVKRTTSLANNNYIYTAGGSGPSGGDDKEVTRMDLSTEVLTSRDMLTADRAYMSSLRTSSYGYFCGGEGPPPFGGKNKSSYQRLDFSTESVIDSSFPSMMNTKRQEFASFQSPEYGYVAGGDGSPGDQCRIERLDFSSETFTYTSNSMPEGREGVNGFCNENFGYIAGGWSPGNRSVIDRMEFSSETMSLPGVELQKGNSYTGGTVSDNGITHF